MFDIQLLRNQCDHAAASLLRRGYVLDTAYCMSIEEQRKRLQTEIEQKRADKNRLVKSIAQHKNEPDFVEEAKRQVLAINEALSGLEEAFREVQQAWEAFAAGLPNLLHVSVPEGQSEADNEVIRLYGEVPVFDFPVLDHLALSESWGIDMVRAAKVTGSRFAVLQDDIARLHRALAQFMLDTHGRSGYHEIAAPYIVHKDSLWGTGQLPKFEADLFALKGQDPFYLVPTAEVSVTNLFRQEILPADMLPMSFVSYGACFRSEAGSAGRDTRGIFRQHQFDKVELIKIVPPEVSYDALETLTQDAERILQQLHLPYRVVLLCSGDIGFSAAKTYDIEVWLPSQGCYREVSSCSNCEAFQARRMKLRYRSEHGIVHPHTLNGSGLAVGRTLIAVMENYQQADGSIVIPTVLRPYMGGQSLIASRRTAVLDQEEID